MKVLILILLLFVSISALSQVKLKSYIETGYYDRDLFIQIDGSQRSIGRILQDRMYSEINLSASLKNFTLEANTLTVIKSHGLVSYSPLQTDYLLRLSYSTKKIVLNCEHLCTHSSDRFIYSGGYTKVGIRLNIF